MPKVLVHVTLKPTLLDAPGRTVENALHSLGFGDISGVRIGKIIELHIPEGAPLSDEAIHERVTAMCDKLLANPVTEDYRIEVEHER